MNRSQTQHEIKLWKKENNRQRAVDLSSNILPMLVIILIVPLLTWMMLILF